MFKLVVFSVLIMAARARPETYVRVQRSPHYHHHGGLGFGGSYAQAESFSGGFGNGYLGGYGGYGGYPVGYGGYPGGYGGYGGYPGGYGGYGGSPGFGGGYSDASAQASSFGIGFDWRK